MFYNMFWIRGEGSVYINIRGEESVIQVSLRGGKCNLLFKFLRKMLTCTFRAHVRESKSIDIGSFF